MKKLDPRRPHGVVYGDHPASFEQDGSLFDAAGNEIGGEAQSATNEQLAEQQHPTVSEIAGRRSRKRPITEDSKANDRGEDGLDSRRAAGE